jgi:chromate transporter
LRVSLALGLTSFGGPVAHLGYFERTYVRQRGWLSCEEYAGLVALCQALPGPASSQVGFLVGLHRAGWRGALAAWLGFTLPSALLLFAAAMFAVRIPSPALQAVLHGLQLVAVAVVAQAVWSMRKRLCPDLATTAIALAAALLLFFGGAAWQLAALGLGALGGLACRCKPAQAASIRSSVKPAAGWLALAVFAAMLAGLSMAAAVRPQGLLALAHIFYRSGALVFGGGHVVLPLLRDSLVPAGWISDERFLAGYGLAQAVPGPLFAFSAYLGAASHFVAQPVIGASVALIAIFLPGLLLGIAGVSLWHRLARYPAVGSALAGVNAAVVGILAAALYDPVWTTAVRNGADAAIALAALLLLQGWKVPPVAIVMFCVACSLIQSVVSAG